MFKLFNAVLVLSVLISGFALYSLEHATRGTERQIARVKRDIGDEKEAIKLLKAEWASLTRPERLQRLARAYLGLTTVTASQIVKFEELGQRVPAEPIIKLEAEGKDPIGDILKKMQ